MRQPIKHQQIKTNRKQWIHELVDNDKHQLNKIGDLNNISENLLFLDCELGRLQLKCLIDSGASSNYISEKSYEAIKTQNKDNNDWYLEEYQGKVKIADSSVIETVGLLRAPMHTIDRTVIVPMIVLKNLSFDCILGMHFIKQHELVIDAAGNNIYFKNNDGQHSNLLSTIQAYEITPYTQVIIKCLNPSLGNTQKMVSNLRSCNDKSGLHIAKGPINCNTKNLNIIVTNLSKSNIIIPPQAIIGTLEQFNQSDITSTEGCNSITESIFGTSQETESNTENQAIEAVQQLEVNRIDLNTEELSNKELALAKSCVQEYKDIFAAKNPGTTSTIKHQIDVGENKPIHQAPFRTSSKERKIIEEETNKMLSQGIIERSSSPWASPVVLVTKKDGSVRFCVDYRKLNNVTIKDVYPLPRIDDALSCLAGNKYFSTLDFTTGYWQIPVQEESKDKTAFITYDGLFEFKVMPFGLTNAPATYQRFMDIILAGLKWKSLLIYLDDICVFSASFDQHIKDLEEVFKRIRQANMKLKPSKCHLFQTCIKNLGHVVTSEGIKPDPVKIKAIENIQTPKNVTMLQSLLGLIGYYRKFVENFAILCAPLYELTKIGVPFIWLPLHNTIV